MYNSLVIFGAKYLIGFSVIFFAWFFLRQDKKKRKEIFVFALISLPLIYVIAKIAGLFYNDPRPFVVGNFNPLIPHAADNGFPSDHTLFSSALAVVVYCFNKKIGLFLLFISLLIGLSRVLAGVHHWVDIIGAIFIAIFVGLVVNFLLKRRSLK